MSIPTENNKVNHHTCLERTPSSVAGDHAMTHTCMTPATDRVSLHGDILSHTCDRLKHSYSPSVTMVNSHVNHTCQQQQQQQLPAAEHMCLHCDHAYVTPGATETLTRNHSRTNHIADVHDNNHVTHLYDVPPMQLANHSCCSTLSRTGSRIKETPI